MRLLHENSVTHQVGNFVSITVALVQTNVLLPVHLPLSEMLSKVIYVE
jgi:hypothetical protein